MAVLSATLSVTIIGTALVVLGVVVLVSTISFWRGSSEDPEALAALEVMADRRFARADDETRSLILDGVRPGAVAPTETSPAGSGDISRSRRRPARNVDDTAPLAPADPLLAGRDDRGQEHDHG